MTEWMTDAACKGQDPNIFHPAKGEPMTAARAHCADCPVVQPCLEYALADPSLKGLWGNMSERDRRNERARRGTVKRGRGPQPIRHGTAGGYQQHRARGETACEACRHAHSEDRKNRKRQQRTAA